MHRTNKLEKVQMKKRIKIQKLREQEEKLHIRCRLIGGVECKRECNVLRMELHYLYCCVYSLQILGFVIVVIIMFGKSLGNEIPQKSLAVIVKYF